jgi:hypothetical protein
VAGTWAVLHTMVVTLLVQGIGAAVPANVAFMGRSVAGSTFRWEARPFWHMCLGSVLYLLAVLMKTCTMTPPWVLVWTHRLQAMALLQSPLTEHAHVLS